MSEKEMTIEEKEAWEQFKRSTSCIHPAILEQIEKTKKENEKNEQNDQK